MQIDSIQPSNILVTSLICYLKGNPSFSRFHKGTPHEGALHEGTLDTYLSLNLRIATTFLIARIC
jgi:hypothetical protein